MTYTTAFESLYMSKSVKLYGTGRITQTGTFIHHQQQSLVWTHQSFSQVAKPTAVNLLKFVGHFINQMWVSGASWCTSLSLVRFFCGWALVRNQMSSSHPSHISPKERATIKHWIGDLVVYRTGLDALAMRKTCYFVWSQSMIPQSFCLFPSHYTDWVSSSLIHL